MEFDEVLAQVIALLQRETRVSFRALKRRFGLDDEYVEDLKDELIYAKQLAVDEDGRVLVWTGADPEAQDVVVPPDQPTHKLSPHQGQPAQAQTPTPEHPTQEAERRQLTVMFCDLVGSTALSEQLDPEELRQLLRAYQEVCHKVIGRFEGHVARYFGDGLLVYFGYPQAHEDDAQRAVRSGLGIVRAMERLNTGLPKEVGVQLDVRIGIHTGLVVAGNMDENQELESMAIVGETPNVAARLQELAEPNALVVSTTTYRLIEGFFDSRDLGARSLKGISQPMGVYQILHESGARSRFDVAATAGLTPLVGRESEVTLLLERWEQVREGMGHVLLLSGEAGIGKSRLAQVLKEHVAQDPQAWLTECRGSPYHQNSPFYPAIDLLERVVLQFERGDSPQEKLSKLEGWLVQHGLSLPEVVPLFASLLSVPLGGRYAPTTLSPAIQKQKTMETLLELLLDRATQQPVLFIVEDLQWADPSTLEWLSLIVDQGPTVRIFALFICRSEFSPPWAPRSHTTLLTLTRLSRQQVELMTRRLAGEKALPTEVLDQVVTRTDGVPLFVEELTKMVLESGLLRERKDRYELTGPLPPLAIPTTLRDSLMARLDRLGTAREVAHLGAALGREFTRELLQAVSPLDETTLQTELERLVEAELLFRRGVGPHATYLFKNALIQEEAYQSMLKSTRQRYHQKIAQVLEAHFPETAETQPELLAHHYTEAGLSEQAIPYWQGAGERAIERSAHVEAIGHLTRALDLLEALPHTPERFEKECALQIRLGVPLTATKGYGAKEVEQTYARARELCQRMGDTRQVFRAIYGLWRHQLLRAEYGTALEQGEELLALAESEQDPALRRAAHRAVGATLFYLGELARARAHLEEVIASEGFPQNQSHALLYDVVDPLVTCRAYEAWVLWLLGYPDQARRQSLEAITTAQELEHPFTLALALSFAAWLHQFCREVRYTQERAEAAVALSTESGFPFWVGWGNVLEGWARAEQGQGAGAIAQMRYGLVAWRAQGSELGSTYFLVLLAEAYGKEGQVEEGLNALAEARAFVDKTGERWWEAELWRVKGELLLQQNGNQEDEAEQCFHKAIDIARHQQAKSLELRAAMSLGRLWKSRDDAGETRQTISEVFGWFTEGHDSADLKEAQALLGELGQLSLPKTSSRT